MLNNFLRTDINKLNTMTKYPSIKTYHKLGKRGMLTDKLQVMPEDIEHTVLEMTEKVDGTNVRIIIHKDDYIIGSREELLYAKGDRIINRNMDIVENTIEIAEKMINSKLLNDDYIFVFYGELYGGTIGKNNKRYSNDKKVFGFRFFDYWGMRINEFNSLFNDYNQEQLSSWRDNMKQPYATSFGLDYFTSAMGLRRVPLLGKVKVDELPTSIQGMYNLLKDTIIVTEVGLTETKDSRAEGFILRSEDRSFITKIRYEDYERTLNNR